MGNAASHVESQIRLVSLEILDQVRVVVDAAAHMAAGHGRGSRSADSLPGSSQSRESQATQARVGGEQ